LYFPQYSECLIWVPWVPFLGLKRLGMQLTTHSYLMPRLKMRGAIPPVANTPSWCGAPHTQTGTQIGVRPLHVASTCSVIKFLVYLGVQLAVMSKMAIPSDSLHSRRVLHSVAVMLVCLTRGCSPTLCLYDCASADSIFNFTTSLTVHKYLKRSDPLLHYRGQGHR